LTTDRSEISKKTFKGEHEEKKKKFVKIFIKNGKQELS